MTSWHPVIPPPAQQQPSSLRRDLIWAYAASFAKIASWVIVSALLFRASPADFAIFAMLRATIGILNYTSLGLAPALVRTLSSARVDDDLLIPVRERAPGLTPPTAAPAVLDYARSNMAQRSEPSPEPHEQATRILRIHSSALAAGMLVSGAGLLLAVVYGFFFEHLHDVPNAMTGRMSSLVIMMGIGVVVRLFSDIQGAVLQVHGKLWLDSAFLTASELIWAALFILCAVLKYGGVNPADLAIVTYLVASIALLAMRGRGIEMHTGWPQVLPHFSLVRWPVQKSLLSYGLIITLGQLADYLYAPVDFILINHFFSTEGVATYAPAVQIDAALLILVTALSTVLLPRAALAHAQGPEGQKTVWKYYLRGTLASAALLASAGALVWLLSPWIFKLWLGSDMPAIQAILPLVLIHTIAGGSSAVGRSILLATGRARAFTLSVLIAGLANVILSYLFVRYANLGLAGIIWGTITVVVARCVFWMPWYIRRAIKQ